MYIQIHEEIKTSLNKRREELKGLGFDKLSKNIFIKENKIIILKSVVFTTNKYEKYSVSIKEEIYQQIKYLDITLEIYERNCFRSKEFLEIYEIPVFQIIPTNTYRNKKTNTMRFKVITKYEVDLINERFRKSVNNIIFNQMVS